MTDRFNALIVVLERDTRDDDAQPLIDAISQMRGVVSVGGNVADIDSHLAYERVRRELTQKLYDALNPAEPRS